MPLSWFGNATPNTFRKGFPEASFGDATGTTGM